LLPLLKKSNFHTPLFLKEGGMGELKEALFLEWFLTAERGYDMKK